MQKPYQVAVQTSQYGGRLAGMWQCDAHVDRTWCFLYVQSMYEIGARVLVTEEALPYRATSTPHFIPGTIAQVGAKIVQVQLDDDPTPVLVGTTCVIPLPPEVDPR